MREQSIIDLTDIASVKPRHSKRPRASANATGAGPTAHHRINPNTDDRSASTATSHAEPAGGPQTESTTDGNAAPAASDRSAWGVDLKSMVFETRLKPGPTKAKRYGGAS